jgi:hypothetical protein
LRIETLLPGAQSRLLEALALLADLLLALAGATKQRHGLGRQRRS